MKDFLNKIFGKTRPKEIVEEENDSIDFSSHSITDETVEYNEDGETRFVRLYNETGGKFLYSGNESELLSYLKEIAHENNFTSFWCADPKLQKYLNSLGIEYTTVPNARNQINLIDCEYLIAFNGSVMISSHQTDNRKLHEMSNTFIVIAYPNQIVDNISDGLRKIKDLKRNNIPTNITTIKGLKHDSMQQTNSKNIYLLLTERT
ncbi:hypothetical protein UJ101_01960 [Flavobacteriaceae bacterium UJ101]|nr:hypothetical protein UJ101_01960 [Flavobacteriaceae bacterium UJ101]